MDASSARKIMQRQGVEHDLAGKVVTTFPDHAVADQPFLAGAAGAAAFAGAAGSAAGAPAPAAAAAAAAAASSLAPVGGTTVTTVVPLEPRARAPSGSTMSERCTVPPISRAATDTSTNSGMASDRTMSSRE